MAKGTVPRVTETDVAVAVLRIANQQPNDIATFDQIRCEAPGLLNLSTGDRRQSNERPNEQMWEQLIRNIKSHDKTKGNFICEGYLVHVWGVGYRITDAGRAHLENLG